MSDISQRMAETLSKPIVPEEIERVTRNETMRLYREGIIAPDLKFSESKIPQSLRRWLGGSDVISSKSLSIQLFGQITENRLEQIRTHSLPTIKEARILSEFFSNFSPEYLTNFIFRRHLKKMRSELTKAVLSPSELVINTDEGKRKDMVLCLVSKAVAIKNGYRIFRLVDTKRMPKGKNAQCGEEARGTEDHQGADAPGGSAT